MSGFLFCRKGKVIPYLVWHWRYSAFYYVWKESVAVAKYRKKPVVIEAVQWLPDKMLMKDVLDAFGGLSGMGSRKITRKKDNLIIETLEGAMMASPGDYIIKGVQGELYPCKPDIFKQTYETV